MKKILNWWNNLPFIRKKIEKWHRENYSMNSNSSYGPDNIIHNSKDEFISSDWVFHIGDIKERYVTWFFHTFTHKCKIFDKTIIWKEGGSTSPFPGPVATAGWITGYEVFDLDSNNFIEGDAIIVEQWMLD